MERDPKRVREILIQRLRSGYRPTRDLDSAEDFYADWLVLPESEFKQVYEKTLRPHQELKSRRKR